MVQVVINGVEFQKEEVSHVRLNTQLTEIKIIVKLTKEKKLIKACDSRTLDNTEIALYDDQGNLAMHHKGFADIISFVTLNGVLIEEVTYISSQSMI